MKKLFALGLDTLRKPAVLQQLRLTLTALMAIDVVFILILVFAHQLVGIKGLIYVNGLIFRTVLSASKKGQRIMRRPFY